MPRITDTQTAVLNIMDYLFIQDVESLASFNDAKNTFNADLSAIIKRINSVRRNEGKIAQLYKHYVLCGLEMMLNLPFEIEDPIEQEQLDKSNYVLDRIIYNVLLNDFYDDEFLDDMKNLFNHFQELRLDKGMIFKVVRQSLYFDYDNVSIVAYKRFIDLGILTTEQYDCDLSTIDEDFLENSFIRSMLFIEFDILKRQFDTEKEFKDKKIEIDLNNSLEEIERIFLAIRSVKKMQLKEKFGFISILDIDINNKKDVGRYIVNLSEVLGHETSFLKKIPDCIGFIGCWYLIHSKELNPDSPTYYELYDDQAVKSRHKKPCDNKALEEISKYGFELKNRTLHSRYIDLYSFYDRMRMSLNF
ncbi:hypothetical protein QSV37_09010 [Acinetobacter sp. VNK23]|uniref:hypothetical protein n=1 Tax=Acinetobacter thutiue TaxID=2998078 RepID=UPI00257555B6|nr:hypothetical protein [Acinetobacter thutiue]MDM1020440.1 hypothetical protein [Acinetobacter thutiue]